MATILIIDDDGDVRDTLAFVLEEAGYETLVASSGAEGARLFRDERPDLIVTDMIMPETDGIEAMRAIQAVNPRARIVAMSGHSFAGSGYYLKLAKRFGAMAVLPKPFEADELLSIVASCLTAIPAEKTPDQPQ
jgi:CheY-like chemotaxis protein